MHIFFTYENWSRNQEALEDNILDIILHHDDELESYPGKCHHKPSRVVVPHDRQLNFYNKNGKRSLIQILSEPDLSIIETNSDKKINSKKNNRSSPSLKFIESSNNTKSSDEIKAKENNGINLNCNF